jgi:hypothetical protein
MFNILKLFKRKICHKYSAQDICDYFIYLAYVDNIKFRPQYLYPLIYTADKWYYSIYNEPIIRDGWKISDFGLYNKYVENILDSYREDLAYAYLANYENISIYDITIPYDHYEHMDNVKKIVDSPLRPFLYKIWKTHQNTIVNNSYCFLDDGATAKAYIEGSIEKIKYQDMKEDCLNIIKENEKGADLESIGENI